MLRHYVQDWPVANSNFTWIYITSCKIAVTENCGIWHRVSEVAPAMIT